MLEKCTRRAQEEKDGIWWTQCHVNVDTLPKAVH
jgi:hypothetical protein